MRTLRGYLYDQSGASAAEYALTIGLIAVAIIAALTVLGTAISNADSSVTNSMNNAISAA
jgi:Flp pilus assembly pilin Flp